MIVIKGKELKLGENESQRLLRPAWTSTTSTGMFNAADHKHDRTISYRFYVRSKGLYKIIKRDGGKRRSIRRGK
jgi:hypothetical protein